MLHGKKKGKAVLTVCDTTMKNFPVGLSILVVDHDRQSLQEVVTNLLKCDCQYTVTGCNQVEEALTQLRKDGSRFDIIIIEQYLLGMYEFELLRICREIDLPVVVTSEDVKPDIVQRSLNYGACDYLPKPIPTSDLNIVWKNVFRKKNNRLAQVQQLTNDVSGVRKRRMSWTLAIHEKFVESVQELGIDTTTAKKVLKRLETKGVRDASRAQVSSHLQKYRLKLKKQMLAFKDKDGTSSQLVQSRCENEMEEHPPLTSHDELLINTDPKQLDILSQHQQAPSTRNTQGFNLPLPVEANSGTTGGQPFVNDLPDEAGHIFGDPSFSLNELWQDGISEIFIGDDMAFDHSTTYSPFGNNLFS